ncbi:MAG: serine/threonine protein kinase [Mariniblastus sp.]
MNQLEVKASGQGSKFAWPRWANVLAIACLIALIATMSIWTVLQSESTLRENVASRLNTILQIETEAVRQWLKSEKTIASFLSSDDQLAELLLEAVNTPGVVTTDLKDQLGKISRKLKNKPCLLMRPDGKVLVHSGDLWLAEQVDKLEDQFCETLMAGKPTVSTVLQHANSKADEASYVIVVAAPVHHPTEGAVGFLGIGLNAETELSKVLESSRTGETGETIAVVGSGQLVSQSRFLGGLGQLDFFQDLLGSRRVQQKPLFHVDLDGETDQRGNDTVYATRWLPQYGLGLVAKMDRAEAFAPVVQIRRFMWTLCGMLMLTTISAIFYRWYVYRLRTLAKQADLNRKRLGAYELEEKIGEGGMGVVYRARHALLRRPTAIKILPPEKSSQTSIERFEREVQYTSQLKHPNTISIYDYGRTESGLFYYAMELLDGLNLENLIQREGPLGDGRAIEILRQVCESLREAHLLGLIHRDIKPANIMLCDRGGAVDTVKVLDFGMVRDRSSGVEFDGSLSGTPIYMAPESFSAPTEIDARVDVFAVGAVGYFLLAGKPIMEAEDLNALLRLHQKDLQSVAKVQLDAVSSKSETPISSRLVDAISRCVATAPKDRFDSVSDILTELSLCRPNSAWNSLRARDWWKKNSANLIDSAPEKDSHGDTKSSNPALDATQAFTR